MKIYPGVEVGLRSKIRGCFELRLFRTLPSLSRMTDFKKFHNFVKIFASWRRFVRIQSRFPQLFTKRGSVLKTLFNSCPIKSHSNERYTRL